MRAKEFLSEADGSRNVTINIPINITIPSGGGDPIVSAAAPAGDDLPDQPGMIFPLQQELELKKQQGGKKSKVINQIVSENPSGGDESEENNFDLVENFEELTAEFNNINEYNSR